MKIKVTTQDTNGTKAFVFDLDDPILMADFAERQGDYPLTLEALKEFIIDRAVYAPDFDGDIVAEVVVSNKYAFITDGAYCSVSCAGGSSDFNGVWVDVKDAYPDGFTCPTCNRKVGV